MIRVGWSVALIAAAFVPLTTRAAQPCSERALAQVGAALKIEGLHADRDRGGLVVDAACSAVAGLPGRSVAAILYELPGATEPANGYGFLLAVLDRRSGRIRGLLREPRMDNDASTEFGPHVLSIRPRTYSSTHKTMIGVVWNKNTRSPACADGFIGPSFYLYAFEGAQLRPVLEDFYLHQARITHGGILNCNRSSKWQVLKKVDMNVGVDADPAIGGFPPLMIKAMISRTKQLFDDKGEYREQKLPGSRSFTYRLAYSDGKYDLDGWQRALYRQMDKVP